MPSLNALWTPDVTISVALIPAQGNGPVKEIVAQRSWVSLDLSLRGEDHFFICIATCNKHVYVHMSHFGDHDAELHVEPECEVAHSLSCPPRDKRNFVWHWQVRNTHSFTSRLIANILPQLDNARVDLLLPSLELPSQS